MLLDYGKIGNTIILAYLLSFVNMVEIYNGENIYRAMEVLWKRYPPYYGIKHEYL